jgi:hypothetical protein
MKDRVTRLYIHTRMAVASWILPLVALLTLSFAGENSLFARQVSARTMNQQVGYDIVVVSMLALAIGFSAWCLTAGKRNVPHRYYWHPWGGLIASAIVIGLILLSVALWHPVAPPLHPPLNSR